MTNRPNPQSLAYQIDGHSPHRARFTVRLASRGKGRTKGVRVDFGPLRVTLRKGQAYALANALVDTLERPRADN